MTDETSFTLGAHGARLDAMDDRIKEIQDTQHADAAIFNAKLDKVVGYIERQKGGLWVMSGIGTLVGALGAILVEWLKR